MAVASPKRKTSKKQLADVNVIAILDMSGSMAGKEVETRGGFNSFVEQAQADQKKEGGKVTISLTCFDTEFITVFDRVPVQNVKLIGPSEYTPRGSTALYDAVGKTLSPLTFPKGEKVMVIITTDGQENSSHEWKDVQVKALIEAKEKEGWEFMFLGVGLNAFAASQAMSSAAMTHNTISTPGTAAAAGATQSTATASGYNSLRAGRTLKHAVAEAYAGHDAAFSAMIDRSVADPLGRTVQANAQTPTPDKAKAKGETTAAKLRRMRQQS